MNKNNSSLVSQLFELRGGLPKKISLSCEIIGISFILVIWTIISETNLIPHGILPSPIKIIKAVPDLHYNDALLRNLLYSFGLNLLGVLEAVILAIPIGFAIGLLPVFQSVFLRYITSMRFLPLSALVGVFIAMFGIFTTMKVEFLAFSIFIYLLPAVIQRVAEVETVYQQTAFTLGASKWQTVRIVFIPAVLSRVWDDIRNLSALSWTYIIIAELVYANGGGIGALAYKAGRQSRIDKVFVILVVIVLVGILWDKFLVYLDGKFFPYKQAKGRS